MNHNDGMKDYQIAPGETVFPSGQCALAAMQPISTAQFDLFHLSFTFGTAFDKSLTDN